MKFIFFVLLLTAVVFNCAAQTGTNPGLQQQGAAQKPVIVRKKLPLSATDSIAARHQDSIAPSSGRLAAPGAPYVRLLARHPYYNFFGSPKEALKVTHEDMEKDGLFYLFAGLVFYFACIKLAFGKYLYNLFAVFFRVSLKQKQIREQLMQSPLPSLLLNVFFTIAGGIFIGLLLHHYHYLRAVSIWYLMGYGTIALCMVYSLKFLMLKLMGWIFYINEATDTYIFAIFLVNKLLGIFLVPFIVLMAFSGPSLVTALITLSFAMIFIFFAYRYIISYGPVRKEIKVSQFHFFLYLCGFEVIPLLLIYKVLITFLERST